MAELDIESIGPKLKGIKLSQLQPELIDAVLELAGEHGYEVTITSSSNLEFLFKIYQAEKAKEKGKRRSLEKAENIILTIAGVFSLHHDTVIAEQKGKREERKRRAHYDAMGEDMRLSRRMRELFESIGIDNEKEMQRSVALLGEEKIEERVGLARASRLGDALVRGVFGENPELIRIVRDEEFGAALSAMEGKKDFIDAWKEANRKLPLWADYSVSPSVLLADYKVLHDGLGEAAVPPGGNASRGEKTVPGRPSAIEASGGAAMAQAPEKEPDLDGLDSLTHPAAARAREAYERHGGGVEGKLAALAELGIDISELSTERESISEETDPESRSKEQARFDSGISLFFGIVVGGGLQNLLGRSPGAEGARISNVKYLPGAAGAFELELSGGGMKKAYLSLQDMEPAQIGREAVEAEGMAAYRIWTRGEDGRRLAAGGMPYAISEDARELGRRGRMTLRMPDLGSESVETMGAAMFKEDLVLRPDPGNDLHSEFYRTLSEPGGRTRVLRALLAYFEMSRRALLADRRPPNTCVLRVAGAGGTTFTFQPTDLDGVGNFIDGGPAGADFSDFNRDFHKAAADFALQMQEGMMRAAARGIIRREDVPPAGMIFREISDAAREPFPPDEPERVAARRGIFMRHDGNPIGIGFDASSDVGHTIPSHGGRSRIAGPDGRVLLQAERAARTAAEAATDAAQAEFLSGFAAGGLAQMSRAPAKAAEICMAMSEAEGAEKDERLGRLRRRAGGEIAAGIYSSPEFTDSRGDLKLQVAERMAREIIFGKGFALPAAAEQAKAPARDERTK